MIIVIQCKDQVGLVASISAILTRQQFNIVSMREHVDKAENLFFARLNVEHGNDHLLQQILADALPHGAIIMIDPIPDKKIVLLVTKEYHCLTDTLIRNHFKTLGATVQCVIGNHANLQNICQRFGMPFYHISHEKDSRDEFEKEIIDTINLYAPHYIVLAKYMRILSPAFVAAFPMQIINIHHSFLPAFIGGNPYRQAFERGVKLIGATAHFVSNELDEGPIIAQQTIAVSHSFTAADMVKAGQEIETSVLAKALKLIFDDRVFVSNNKTIVFE